jgi:hypothetical protein
MPTASDPISHRKLEQRFIEHVERALQDPRLRLPTIHGRRPVVGFHRDIAFADHEIELKRQMAQSGVFDRDIQSQMPIGRELTVTLSQTKYWFFKKKIGQLRVICMSPTEALLTGKPAEAVGPERLKTALTAAVDDPLPTAVVLVSTGGFTPAARELARQPAGAILVLAEPSDVGGWSLTCFESQRDLTEVFDPENDQEKCRRIEAAIEESRSELLTGSLSAEQIARKTDLPVPFVEMQLESYAQRNPGLAAKRLNGRIVLFRGASQSAGMIGGLSMPFWEKIKAVLRLEASADQKIARLAEQRALLTQERSAVYEEVGALEKKESDLAASFASSTSMAQRRIAAEISQLRKEMERKHQFLGTVEKKLNVVNAGIHSLQMEKHVAPAEMERMEEIAQSSETVEDGMAALDQLNEDADAMTAATASEMPEDVRAIMDELKGKSEAAKAAAPAAKVSIPAQGAPAANAPIRTPPIPSKSEPRRSEPEAG